MSSRTKTAPRRASERLEFPLGDSMLGFVVRWIGDVQIAQPLPENDRHPSGRLKSTRPAG